jgi:hypothetical protein
MEIVTSEKDGLWRRQETKPKLKSLPTPRGRSRIFGAHKTALARP